MIYLLSLILAAHLLCMNLASAGPLLAIWLDRRSATASDSHSDILGKKLLIGSIVAFFLGMVLGGLQAWLMYLSGEQAFFEVVARFWDTKIYFGFWELAFYVACLAGYLALWFKGNRKSNWQLIFGRFLAVLAATNLLYHFPTLFGVISHLVKTGETTGDTIQAAEFRSLMAQGEVIWLSIHFTFASFAVAGVFVAWLAIQVQKEEIQEEAEEKGAPVEYLVGRSALISLISSVAQLPVGLFFLLSLGSLEKNRLMGGDLLASGVFLSALLLAFWLMHVTAGLAFFQRNRKQLYQTVGVLVLTVLTMSLSLLLSRGS